MDFVHTLFKRRSIRRFRQEAVSDRDLLTLIEAARVAPSAANRQALRFIAITSPAMVKSIFPLTRWGAKVAPRRMPAVGKDAPLAFIAVYSAETDNFLLGCDTGAAVENILLRAVDIGLGCCWICAFDHAAVDKQLALPENMHTISLIAVGKPAETPELTESECEKQLDYYLDEKDILHVPKLTVDQLVKFI